MWHQKAKGPPDGPPIFLIFVEKLNCPQSQAYQSISPVGTGLSLTDRALGVSLGTSIGNYSPLIAPQPVKLKIHCQQWRAGSIPATGTTSSRTSYRSRRRFFVPNKRRRSLAPSLLLSKSQPLLWVAILSFFFTYISTPGQSPFGFISGNSCCLLPKIALASLLIL